MPVKKSDYKAEQIDTGTKLTSDPEGMVQKANSLIDAINTMEQAKVIMASDFGAKVRQEILKVEADRTSSSPPSSFSHALNNSVDLAKRSDS